MKVGVPGKPENKRGMGLEVSCLVTVKVSQYIFSKEPSIKNYIFATYSLKKLLICVTSDCQ